MRVATYAAQLYLDGYGEYIVFSSGVGNFTEGVFDKAETKAT